VAGTGQVLDRLAPLVLGKVERWVEEVTKVIAERAATAALDGAVGTARDAGAVDVAEAGRLPLEGEDAPTVAASAVPPVAPPEEAVPVETSPESEAPVDFVSPAYHQGFVAWINEPRLADIDEKMTREDWAASIGKKFSVLNWKFVGRRKGVDTSGLSREEAVMRLMVAFQADGRPSPAPAKGPPSGVDVLLKEARDSVAVMRPESDTPNFDAKEARLAVSAAGELIVVNEKKARLPPVDAPTLPSWGDLEQQTNRPTGAYRGRSPGRQGTTKTAGIVPPPSIVPKAAAEPKRVPNIYVP